jgi:hypothetical protein
MNILNLGKALNKAFLKVKPERKEIENFRTQLIRLLGCINEKESEEFHKILVSDFLKKTYYDDRGCFINTKGRNDLVIHSGNNAESSVGVIIETKKPGNKTEMPKPDKLNTKAFQELVLYYLRERITLKNLEIRHLIITDIYEWFIFDANIFEKAFAGNKDLVRKFKEFENGVLSGKTTDFFYKEIAAPAIEAAFAEIGFVCFDIREYEEVVKNQQDNTKLIRLFKVFSPEHLLKLPFANDSNTLDKIFYAELLHIIGLTETKQGGKKLIRRKKEGERNPGSLLENTITELGYTNKITQIKNLERFGETPDERLFNAGLGLAITWVNRLLFLRLLEAQITDWYKGDKSYAFLNSEKIRNFHDLSRLFFQVLARKPEDRDEPLKQDFEKIPYLNSSLFEITELEQNTFTISCLDSGKKLPLYSATVLRESSGKKRTGELNTLGYIFEFLDAYDFASEGAEEIQEERKSLINASVLGLIFEKINGYQDGSFFTPGFVTMYMCRETISKAAIRKFNERKGWKCQTLDDLYDKIEDRQEANEIINDLKICDPAVGSGHFLVSALNEIIALKSRLRILTDREGKRLKEYHAEVANDDLIVTDEDGELFVYNPGNKESRRVQETLFHEKQKIIENCLFGVDINPNSVRICCLRLWIELLKHAYYNDCNELETLPNIDINIRHGNSLINRFGLDADMSQTLKKSKWNLDSYKIAVQTYRKATGEKEKQDLRKLIADIKKDFRADLGGNNPKVRQLKKLGGDLYDLVTRQELPGFEETAKEKKTREQKQKRLEKEIAKLKAEIDEFEGGRIYDNAFEWRFEFPEVLNDDSEFVGFDVVIGNPPYGIIFGAGEKKIFKKRYESAKTVRDKQKGSSDSFSLFIEKGLKLCNEDAMLSYIVPMAFVSSESMSALHKMMFGICETLHVSTYSNRPRKIFENADQRTAILICHKNNSPTRYLYSTKVNKHYKNTPVQEVMDNLRYVDSYPFVRYGRLPKVGSEIETGILRKLFSLKSRLADLSDENGLPIYYRTSGGRYYNIITNFETGSTKENSVYIRSKYRDTVGAILSSNLYYWFYHIYSNNLDLKSYELEIFPIPVENFSPTQIGIIDELYKDYLADLNKNSKVKKADYANIDSYREYYARYSKHLIDKIDMAIQDPYGLTDDEIHFIINYDIEFRTDNDK